MAKTAKKTKKVKTFEPDVMVLIGAQCKNGHRTVLDASALEVHAIAYPLEGIYVDWYCGECPLETRELNSVQVGF